MSEFRFNVSQLLQEPTGSMRRYELNDECLQLEQELVLRPVVGNVRMTRTPRGVLADVKVQGNVELECSRCLTAYEQPLELDFSEEFYQTVNVNTGASLPTPEEDDVFLIDETHKLDLADPMREYTLIGLPPAPRCDEACKGLCSQCGQNLNEGTCDCEPNEVDERFAALNRLLQ
jgi:uncharacterized protein